MIRFFSPPLRPVDEEGRQAAVDRSGLLGLRGDPALERIVAEAAAIRATPISAVSIIDHDRQAFPVRLGIDADETSRAVSFCGHAILEPGRILVVEDALQDPRFAANPFVTGDPGIRFYAGATIMDRDGHALGALCVIDTVPGSMSDAERDRLVSLADQIGRQATIV